MAERVEPYDLGVTWDPNAPHAILLAEDAGKSVLALNPHPADSDSRCVVLVWSGTSAASLGGPNDEAISGHPLYRKGLVDVLWAAVVHGSTRIRDLQRQHRVHPHHDPARFAGMRHYLVLQKECLVEVVAESLVVQRRVGSTLDAAVAALRD